jgi:hypothetical protein
MIRRICMTNPEMRLDDRAMEQLLKQASDAASHRLGLKTPFAFDKAKACANATSAYESAFNKWRAAGSPSSGPIMEAAYQAALQMSIFCGPRHGSFAEP